MQKKKNNSKVKIINLYWKNVLEILVFTRQTAFPSMFVGS